MIESVDRGVGRIVGRLEALGLTSETVIVFSSDNGGLGGYASAGLRHSRDVTDNHPLKGGKGQLYEGGIRVPTFVVWPGVTEPGSASDVPVIGTDVYPTLLEVADVEPCPGQALDGESLVPLLRGDGRARTRGALLVLPRLPPSLRGQAALRTGPAAAVRHGDEKLIWFFEDDRLELYDLSAGPRRAARPRGVRTGKSGGAARATQGVDRVRRCARAST